jgi:triphosphatase
MDLANPSLVLSLDAKAFESIRRSLLLRHVASGGGSAVSFRRDRLDTASFDLWAQSASLERDVEARLAYLRQISAMPMPVERRYDASVKAPAPSKRFDPSLWDDQPGKKAVPFLVFATERGKRRHFRIASPSWSIRLDLEKGQAKAGRSRAGSHRILLSLERGQVEDLARLVHRLAEIAPVQPDIFPAARWIDRAQKRKPSPRKSRPIPLVAEARVRHAVRLILLFCLDHFCVNLAVLGGNDPVEAVHQMRVALRRLRSAIGLFSRLFAETELKRLKPELKWLGGILGGVRDLDVFLSSIHAPVRKAFPRKKELAALQNSLSKVRNTRFKAMRAVLAGPRAARLLADVWALAEGLTLSSPNAQLDGLATAYAKALLGRRYAKMLKAGQGFEQLTPALRHRLRIQAKKLRYAIEFFLALFGAKHTKPYLVKLVRLLDALGHLNDLAVAHATLDAPPDGKDHAKASSHVLNWHVERKEKLLAEAEEAWKSVVEARPFWI